MSLAIMPRTKADQHKLQCLGKLMAEDQTFGIKSDEETGQTHFRG
jgi:translation elongation factor EF-G